jgi:hypothetical protein
MRPTLTVSHLRFPVPQHSAAFTDHPRRGWTHRLGLALFLALAAALVVG